MYSLGFESDRPTSPINLVPNYNSRPKSELTTRSRSKSASAYQEIRSIDLSDYFRAFLFVNLTTSNN